MAPLLSLLARVIDLRLNQEFLGLLEEQLLRRLVAEAIGLAVIDGIDRAVGLDVLAEREPHHAFAAELAFGGERRACAKPQEHGGEKDAKKPDAGHDASPMSLGDGSRKCGTKSTASIHRQS